MPRRVDAGALVAALGGVLLLVSLFLDWFGDGGEGVSAWTVFEIVDLLLAGIALLAISTFLSRAGVERRLPDVSLILLGGAALVLVASQLINEPPLAQAADDIERGTGAWLGLAGSAVLLAGAVISVARVSFSVERRTGAVQPATPAEPETETVRMTPPDRPV
jgi:carbon starvation protein CstA